MKFVFGFLTCLVFCRLCAGSTEPYQNHAKENVELVNEEKKSANSAPRIVDGERASLGEFPWMVSLYYKGKFRCGASILNKNTVLTAAHCVNGYKRLKRLLQVRTADIKMRKRDPYERRYSVKKVTMHHKYKRETWAAKDIAIIKLRDDIKYDEYTQPIEIATRNKERLLRKVGRCSLSGFGYITEKPDKKYPRALQKIDLTLQTQGFCRKLVISENYFNKYSICTYEEEQGSPCQGDSGSPLVCYDDEEKAYQIGVVSWGSVSCAKRYAFYARVSRNLRWIKRQSR